MPANSSLVWSSVGRKILMALTGLLWVVFVFFHLLGNLLLFAGVEPYNKYSHLLLNVGEGGVKLVWLAEGGLVVFLLVHIIAGVAVTLENWAGRNTRYELVRDAEGPSRKTFSSRMMPYTGILLFVFIFLHVWMFKYGPYYETVVDGVKVRDLYKLVIESFQSLPTAAFYVICMIILGLHLRHGIWSAFQSLGVSHRIWTPVIYFIGTLCALAFALGFIVMPVWIYLGGGK